MTQDLPRIAHLPWTAETRHGPARMAARFLEFGRFVRRPRHETRIPSRGSARPLTALVQDLKGTDVSDTIALVTRDSKLTAAQGTGWGNRASPWDRSSGRWLLRVHTGTPTLAKASP